MARYKSANPFLKPNNDTGFGSNPNNYGGRFINKDGTFNLKREGINLFDRFSVYQRMLNLPTWKFGSLIVLYYFGMNLLFTIGYALAGIDQLQGFITTTPWGRLKETFFFSTQTFVTVGYGRLNPAGDVANVLSSIESLVGFLSFAIITGLIYGRFSRPRTYLAFSDFAVVAPYRDKTALMFRFANYKDNHILTNVEIKVNVALMLEENGNRVFKFYDLALERNKVDNLPMNWTVVHAIDENSPLYGYNESDYSHSDMELYILITGFDEIYSAPVLRRTSYTYKEIKFNAKFASMYRESEDGQMTILELHKLNSLVEAIPSAAAAGERQ
ncbi:MAG TPA: ion channel [Chitinophagales bacterium]|nr:ion channel [Chitinophagales bacterium]